MGGPGSGRSGSNGGKRWTGLRTLAQHTLQGISDSPPVRIRAETDPTGAKEALLDAIEGALVLPTDIENDDALAALPADRRTVPFRNAIWLRFCGLSIEDISERTSITHGTLTKWLRSPTYYAAYDRYLPQMLEKVNEEMRRRLQSILLEAIEVKIHLMRHGKQEKLRNQIATELFEMGQSALQLGRGNVSDMLMAIHEQATRERKDGTRTTTKRVTLEGTPEAVAAAMRGNGAPHEDGRGRDGDGTDDPAGRDGRDEGASEVAALADGGRGDSGDGSGSL